jgi:hypothetical protein
VVVQEEDTKEEAEVQEVIVPRGTLRLVAAEAVAKLG